MDKVYYISQGDSVGEHLVNIENACLAGCRLVQLRLKQVDQEEYSRVAIAARGICHQFGTKLIVNDSVEVALACNADGVHVGQEDQNAAEAKERMNGKLVGGTANTIEQCLEMIEKGVDYLGIGPFRHTETKAKLSPILGLEGIREIQKQLNTLGHNIPVYAIGGIQLKDIQDLMDTGIHGIAVSGLMSSKSIDEIKEAVNEIKSKAPAQTN